MTNRKKNPYIIGSPIYEPEAFYGREELFTFIGDNLRQRTKVILLHGQRRIGKTSIQHQVRNFVQLDGFVFFLFDLQNQANLKVGHVLHNLAMDMVEFFDVPQSSVSIPTRPDMEKKPDLFHTKVLPHLSTALSSNGTPTNLVLLLDEFDVLSDNRTEVAVEKLFPYLNRIVYSQHNLFLIPVVGRRLEEMPTMFSMFKSAPHREIGLLSRENAVHLITKPAEGVLEYSDDAIEAILELASGHPYFTQLLCFTVFGRAQDEGLAVVTRTEVEASVEKAIESGEGGLVWFRDGLPIAERVVFAAVAEAQQQTAKTFMNLSELLDTYGIIATEALLNAEERLIEWDFLRKREYSSVATKQAYRYIVAIELVRRWFIRRHPIQQTVWELDHLDPEAERIYQEATAAAQHNEHHHAVTLYQQALEANPNHVHALFALIEALLSNTMLSNQTSDMFEEAVTLCKRANRIDFGRIKDSFAQTLFEYARMLMLRGDFVQEKQALQQVLELEPDNERAQEQVQDVDKRIRWQLNLQNPFTTSTVVQPARFVGRERERGMIFSQIRNHSSIAIYGDYGIGKSSLLKYVGSPDVWKKLGLDRYLSSTLIACVECHLLAPFTPDKFWQEVVSEMAAQHTHASVQQELAPYSSNTNQSRLITGKDVLRIVQLMEANSGQFLLLLIDDLDRAIEACGPDHLNTFLIDLRALALSSAASVVATTRRSLSNMPRVSELASISWYQALPHLGPLKPFDTHEIKTMHERLPFERSKVELTWLKDVAGGYPYLLAEALSILYLLHVEQKPFHVGSATDMFVHHVQAVFADLWNTITDYQKDCITSLTLCNMVQEMHCHLLEEKIHAIKPQYWNETFERNEFQELVQRGLVIPKGNESNTYALVSFVLEWWIIHKTNGPVTWLNKRNLDTELDHTHARDGKIFLQTVREHARMELYTQKYTIQEAKL